MSGSAGASRFARYKYIIAPSVCKSVNTAGDAAREKKLYVVRII